MTKKERQHTTRRSSSVGCSSKYARRSETSISDLRGHDSSHSLTAEQRPATSIFSISHKVIKKPTAAVPGERYIRVQEGKYFVVYCENGEEDLRYVKQLAGDAIALDTEGHDCACVPLHAPHCPRKKSAVTIPL